VKYNAKVLHKIENRPGTWDSLKVGVFRLADDGSEDQIGEYVRNHGNLYDTFFPFEQNGKHLALYSPDYTATRLMELPSCKDIGGELAESWGFCPVDFFVPTFLEQEIRNTNNKICGETQIKHIHDPGEKDLEERSETHNWINQITQEPMEAQYTYIPLSGIQYYKFGFVAGCIWGDDSSWKVQYLDLSRASEGLIKRDERFGYIELPSGMRLKEAIDMRGYHGQAEDHTNYIRIQNVHTFDLRSGKIVDPFE
jgi:hypothetical protein